MLSHVARFLRGGESVHLEILRLKGGKLRLFVQPVLGPEPDNLSDEQQQLRAALAVPVRIDADEGQLDEVLPALLQRGAAARDLVADQLEAGVQKLESVASQAAKPAPKALPAPASGKKAPARAGTRRAAGRVQTATGGAPSPERLGGGAASSATETPPAPVLAPDATGEEQRPEEAGSVSAEDGDTEGHHGGLSFDVAGRSLGLFPEDA